MLPFFGFGLSSHLFVAFFSVMDTKAVFAALYGVCEENATIFSAGVKSSQGDAARRLVDVMNLIQEHARCLEPVICGFASVYHHFDFDPHIPANGYRSLVKVLREPTPLPKIPLTSSTFLLPVVSPNKLPIHGLTPFQGPSISN